MAIKTHITNLTTIERHKTYGDGDSTINRRRMLKMTTAIAIARVSANSMSSKGALAATALTASDMGLEAADVLATDHICTAEEAAVIDFEPWVDCVEPPTNEQWKNAVNPYLVATRIAWVTCQKTKDELVKVLEDIGNDDELSDDFFNRFQDARQFFEYFHNLFEKAEARIICVGSVLEVREKANHIAA